MSRTTFLCRLTLAAALVLAGSKAHAQTVVYKTDFESGSGSEWSLFRTSSRAIGAAPGAGRFLGEFSNESTRLSLNGLATHTRARVQFDLFIIGSWDGNGNFVGGVDRWSLGVTGGPTLVDTTFSNTGPEVGLSNRQAYPGSYPGGDHAARTGSVSYTGGVGNYGDTHYRIVKEFDHSGSSLGLDFSSQTQFQPEDETWGLDNVCVELLDASAVPEPHSVLLAICLAPLVLRLRRTRR